MVKLKKWLAIVATTTFVSLSVVAQKNENRIPFSFNLNEGAANIDLVQLPAPDYKSLIESEKRESTGMYKVAMTVDAAVNLNNGGGYTYLENGSIIWRKKISIDGAKGIGPYFDDFYLPEGVTLFAYDTKGNHLRGPYTKNDNNINNVFGISAIKGSELILELNINPKVDISTIKLNGYRFAAFYKDFVSVSDGLYDNDPISVDSGQSTIAPSSSACEITAFCPQGDGYDIPRNASARIVIANAGGAVGFCSGTLMNNSEKNCTPYFLTASHCEGTNSFTNSTFAYWQFDFNLQYLGCGKTTPKDFARTVVGADFVMRSTYPVGAGPNPPLNSDNLLLKFTDPQYDSKLITTNAALAGWYRRSSVPAGSDFWVGFHHPAGDYKMLITANDINPLGSFNTGNNGTHWGFQAQAGGVEGGSSGSGIFNQDGLLIGDLSGSPNMIDACGGEMSTSGIVYSKISRAWSNPPDGDGTSKTELQPHLAPGNPTLNDLEGVSYATCKANLSVRSFNKDLASAISVYPNPTIDGIVNLNFNFDKLTKAKLTILDITGRVVKDLGNIEVLSGNKSFIVGSQFAGLYVLSIQTEEGTATKKIIFSK